MDTIGSQRLKSLDVMRGLTMACMVMVNSPGSWSAVYAPLCHASWNGFTPTDMVFPFFVFMLGVSIFASLRKFDFKPSGQTFIRIIRRTVSIFLVAWALNLFGRLMDNGWDFVGAFQHLRILGVLPRLALCYFFASVTVLYVPQKWIKWVIAALLAIYLVILKVTNGLVQGEGSTLCAIDFKLFGPDHAYGFSSNNDPEGILSTIPAIAHTLIGFCVGKWIFSKESKDEVLAKMLLLGAALVIAGLLLGYGCPINKKVWTPTFVLTTCGFGSLLLGLFYWFIDIRGHRKGWGFFETFGVNAITCYALAAISTTVIDLHPLFDSLSTVVAPEFASLCCALIRVAIVWLPAFILKKFKIFIKL